MAANTDQLDVRTPGGVAADRFGIGIGNAELVVPQAGRDVGVRPGIDIRIDAKRNGRLQPQPPRDGVDAFEFARRL